MTTVWNLFKLQIDERTNFFKKSKFTKSIFKILAYLLVIALVTVALTFVFLRFVSIGFYPDVRLFAFLLLISQAISFCFSLGNIFKTLFFSKDNDLLMSLPCAPNQVFLSKIMVIYFFEFIANAICTIPIFITYAIIASSVNVMFLVLIPVFLIILPLFPLALASLVSLPIMAFIGFLKKHQRLMIACTIVFTFIFFVLYTLMVFKISNMLDFTGAQSALVVAVNKIISQVVYYSWFFLKMAEGMLFLSGWWWKLMAVLAIIFTLIMLSYIVVKKFYFKIAMKNFESKQKVFVKPQINKFRSPFASLLHKEALQVFRSPGYIFEFFTFSLLMPFIVLTYDKLLSTITVNHTGVVMIAASHVLIIAMLAMLSNISSASAVSREGSNFYWGKITPMSYKTQCLAKITFNAIITLAALFVTAVVSIIFSDISPVHIICGTIAVMIASIGHIVLSFMFDLKKPVLDWYDSSEIDKISKSTQKSMVVGLAIAIVLFLVVFLFAPTKHTIWPWTIIISIASVFTITVILFAIVKIKKYFERAGA